MYNTILNIWCSNFLKMLSVLVLKMIMAYLLIRVLYGNDSNDKNKDKISLLGKILMKVSRNVIDGICGISNNWNFNCCRRQQRHLNWNFNCCRRQQRYLNSSIAADDNSEI